MHRVTLAPDERRVPQWRSIKRTHSEGIVVADFLFATNDAGACVSTVAAAAYILCGGDEISLFLCRVGDEGVLFSLESPLEVLSLLFDIGACRCDVGQLLLCRSFESFLSLGALGCQKLHGFSMFLGSLCDFFGELAEFLVGLAFLFAIVRIFLFEVLFEER